MLQGLDAVLLTTAEFPPGLVCLEDARTLAIALIANLLKRDAGNCTENPTKRRATRGVLCATVHPLQAMSDDFADEIAVGQVIFNKGIEQRFHLRSIQARICGRLGQGVERI